MDDPLATSGAVNLQGVRVLHVAHGLPSYSNSLRELVNRLQCAKSELLIASHIDLGTTLPPDTEFTHLHQDKTINKEYANESSTLPLRDGFFAIYKRFILARKFRNLSCRNTEIEELISRFEPDILLIDMECHYAIVVSRKLNIPTILTSRWFSVTRFWRSPPMHTDLPADTTFSNQLRICNAWVILYLFKYWKFAREIFSKTRFRPLGYGTVSRLDLDTLCKAHKLDPFKCTSIHDWLIPHTYPDLPVMSFNARELELPAVNDSNTHYVGPMISLNPPHADGQTLSNIDFLEDFCARNRIDNRPLIYCSLSTFWDSGHVFLETLIEVFRTRTEWSLIVGMGGRKVSLFDHEIPENVLLIGHAPQIDIIRRASIVITHGGISTINEALYFGVPLLVYCSAHVDQNGCQTRVLHHHAGIAVETRPATTVEIESRIDCILTGEEGGKIRTNVAKIQRVLRLYHSSFAAEKLILSQLNNTTQST